LLILQHRLTLGFAPTGKANSCSSISYNDAPGRSYAINPLKFVMTNRVSSIVARRWLSAIGFVLASLSPLAIIRADEPFVLAWPVACELGQTCFIQNFVDHDSSGAAKDFRCGSRTYNNHDGTD
jgi:hypothetical protein